MSSAGSPPRSSSTTGQRAFIGIAILCFAAASAYLALVIITRVDSMFGPGNQITLPGGSSVAPFLPGVDAEGESGSEDRVNILVVGVDQRPRDGDTPGRTDTIFVVTVDPKTNSTGILGIPRDLVVDIPYSSGNGTYDDRINTVYVAGEMNGYEQGGIELLKEVIYNNFTWEDETTGETFHVEIDHHVIVDFEGFEEIIDALGGIDVDVPEEVYDPYYSESELPGDYDPQYFEAGRQHMDGRTALAYSRIRFSSDDLDRIQRQQRVIFATIEKAKSLDVLSKALTLWDKYKDAVQTDISDLKLPGYARLANDAQDNIHAISLGPATVPYTTPQGAAVLIGDKEAMGDIVRSLFIDEPGTLVQATATPDPVRVQVQNGTGEEGLAARVVSYIASKGYPVNDLNSSNVFDDSAHAVSVIIDLDGTHERNRLLLANWLNIDLDNVRAATPAELEAIGDTNAEIIVILGSDVDYDSLIRSPATSTPGG